MKEDSFLKKFKGRMQQIGKNGYSDILNNVHINIVDYIQKPKKIKKTKVKVEPYVNIKSEISEEFNKNKNFMPKTKNLSKSPQKNKIEETDKMNDNNVKSIRFNNINKFNMKNSIENNKNKKKEKEKPIKLLKSIKFNIINRNDNKKSLEIQTSGNHEKRINKMRNNKKIINLENNDKLTSSKKRSNSIKLNLKLPSISQSSKLERKNTNNLISKNSNNNLNKSHDRVNTFTPKFINKITNNYSKIFIENVKKPLNKRQNIENGNLKNYEVKKEFNLPKIDKNNNKKIKIENDKNAKIYNKEKDKILNSIKNDFLMLDSIKNRGNNIDKNQINSKKVNNNNNLNQYKKNINKKNQSTNNPNFDNLMDSNDSLEKEIKIKKQNNLNKNLSRNNNLENINMNEVGSLGTSTEKKPHTSFDYPQNIPKIKNKLDIINEENEEDNNKYITDVKFNNSIDKKENLNSLEILMKQRAHFQNKIPNDSRFKIK